MALKKTILLVDNFGELIEFQDAYIKVSRIAGDKSLMLFDVDAMKAKDGVLLTRKSFELAPNLDGENFIAQAYAHLKTLPEFDGAQDC